MANFITSNPGIAAADNRNQRLMVQRAEDLRLQREQEAHDQQEADRQAYAAYLGQGQGGVAKSAAASLPVTQQDIPAPTNVYGQGAAPTASSPVDITEIPAPAQVQAPSNVPRQITHGDVINTGRNTYEDPTSYDNANWQNMGLRASNAVGRVLLGTGRGIVNAVDIADPISLAGRAAEYLTAKPTRPEQNTDGSGASGSWGDSPNTQTVSTTVQGPSSTTVSPMAVPVGGSDMRMPSIRDEALRIPASAVGQYSQTPENSSATNERLGLINPQTLSQNAAALLAQSQGQQPPPDQPVQPVLAQQPSQTQAPQPQQPQQPQTQQRQPLSNFVSNGRGSLATMQAAAQQQEAAQLQALTFAGAGHPEEAAAYAKMHGFEIPPEVLQNAQLSQALALGGTAYKDNAEAGQKFIQTFMMTQGSNQDRVIAAMNAAGTVPTSQQRKMMEIIKTTDPAANGMSYNINGAGVASPVATIDGTPVISAVKPIEDPYQKMAAEAVNKMMTENGEAMSPEDYVKNVTQVANQLRLSQAASAGLGGQTGLQAQASGAMTNLPVVTDPAVYSRMPDGTAYISPDGIQRIKGQ